MIAENPLHYAWYESTSGALLLEAEQQNLDQLLTEFYGFHLLQVAEPALSSLVRSSPVAHRILVDPYATSGGGHSLLRTMPDHLSIKTNSVDVVVLSHALEQTPRPHRLLREAHRVLLPEGYLVVTGLNPRSLWGIWYWLLGLVRPMMLKRGRLISLNRVCDWLTLLDFKVIRSEYFHFNPPMNKLNLMSRLVFWEKLGKRGWPFLGGGYQIVAVKRVIGLTPVRPVWKVQPIWPVGVATTSSSVRQNVKVP